MRSNFRDFREILTGRGRIHAKSRYAASVSSCPSPISFLDMWMTGGGNNDAQYANDDYDALIKQAKTTTDNAERMDLLHQAEDKLIGEDSVLAPLYFYTQKYMLADGIEGMYYCPLGYFFFGYTHQA